MQVLVGGGLSTTRLGIRPGRVGGGAETTKGVAGGGTLVKSDQGARCEGGFLGLSELCYRRFLSFTGRIHTYYDVLHNFLERLHEIAFNFA